MTQFQREISVVALLLAFSFGFFFCVEIVPTVAAAIMGGM